MLKTTAKLELAVLREDHVQREQTKVDSNTLSYRRPLSRLEKLCASKVPSNSYLRGTDVLKSSEWMIRYAMLAETNVHTENSTTPVSFADLS